MHAILGIYPGEKTPEIIRYYVYNDKSTPRQDKETISRYITKITNRSHKNDFHEVYPQRRTQRLSNSELRSSDTIRRQGPLQ